MRAGPPETRATRTRPGQDARAPLLEVVGLQTHFFSDEGVARAVDGISFTLREGETLGVVGESGCGKSVTSLSIMRLVPDPPGRTVGGKILFRGQDLLDLSDDRMRRIRGNDIAMVFQEPMMALNPVYTVGNQIMETVMLHRRLDRRAARDHAVEMLQKVGIPSPEARVEAYPHELSGGMKQRVMLAMAMSCDPKLLIADEPTTALDVTIQAQILDLIRGLQESAGMGMLLITHDLGVVAEMAHRVAVMYAGKIVEYAEVGDLFDRPRHPYTIGLFKSLPDLAAPGQRLATIPGIVPPATRFPSGCRFRTRCPLATAVCAEVEPPLLPVAAGSEDHTTACHHVEEALAL